MTIDLQHVDDVHDALDARSEDCARFIPLFGGRDQFGFVALRDGLEDQTACEQAVRFRYAAGPIAAVPW